MSKPNSGYFKGTIGQLNLLIDENIDHNNITRTEISTISKNSINSHQHPKVIDSSNNTVFKKIYVKFEYGCYPIWFCNENGDVINTPLPEDLSSNTELNAKFDNLQARYDALFVNTDLQFSFKGFSSLDEKEQFLTDLQLAIDELIIATKNKYTIIDDYRRAFSS